MKRDHKGLNWFREDLEAEITEAYPTLEASLAAATTVSQEVEEQERAGRDAIAAAQAAVVAAAQGAIDAAQPKPSTSTE